MAARNHPDVRFIKIDSDKEHSLVKEFNIHAVPSVLVFRQSLTLFAQQGSLSFAEIEDLIDKAQSLDMQEVLSERQKQYE